MASFDSHSFCARCREKGKGSDPCISNNDCTSCNSLTEDQCLQLSTPSYRLKTEKRDLKKTSDTPKQDSSSSSLIYPSSVMVVGAVDALGILQSPGSSSGKKKKANPSEKPKAHSSKDPKTGTDKASKSGTSKSHRSSPDARIDELDQKWAERFNRLEALLLAKSLDKQEPAFTSVKVTPAHSPPPGSVISTKPFIRPQAIDSSVIALTTQIQATDQSQGPDTAQQSSDLPGKVQTASKSTSKSSKGKVAADRHSDLAGTDSPLSQQVPSRSSSAPARRISRSEEQNYCETMSGIRSFMGWSHIPEIDTAASKSGDNPFAGPKAQPTGKVSVTMPTDEWLCSKMGKLNLTLTEVYPSCSSEAGGLLKDRFVRPPKSQSIFANLISKFL